MKTYAEKLKDPRWQRKRLEILNRDNFTCQCCFGTEDTLHVHHSHYRKGADPWDYEDEHLVSVCEGCHKCVEQGREELLQLCSDPQILFMILRIAQGCRDGLFPLISTFSSLISEPADSDSARNSHKRIAERFLKDAEKLVTEIINQ